MARKQLGLAANGATDVLNQRDGMALIPSRNTFADGRRTSDQVVDSQVFTTINLNVEASDVGANFDPGTGLYTVPAAGIYTCGALVRLKDGSSALQNVGVGIHTSNNDGPWFQWFLTRTENVNPTRLSFGYSRIAQFNAGDQLRLYVWCGSGATFESAQMTVIRTALV